MPRHGGPSASAAPRSRPLHRRSQPTTVASEPRSSAERIGAGRLRRGVGDRTAGPPGAGAGISGCSRWSRTSIGDKSEMRRRWWPTTGCQLSAAFRSPLTERGAGSSSPEPLPPPPTAPFLPRQRSAAGRMHYAKQIVKDFEGRSQAAIRN